MWRAASVVKALALLLFFAWFAVPRTFTVMVAAILLLGASDVMEDVGGPLAVGRPPTVRWSTWLTIAFAAVGLSLLVAR